MSELPSSEGLDPYPATDAPNPTTLSAAKSPFGGYKKSGLGRDLGPEQLDYVTETKTIWITLT